MALIKLPYLLKIIEAEKLIYWKVSDGAGLIDSYQENKGDADESINKLQECLDNLEGYYDVILSARNGTETAKGGDVRSAAAQRKFKIKCDASNNISSPTINGNQQQNSDKYLQEIKNLYQQNSELQKQILEAANEKRFADLEKKFNDLKAEYEDNDEDDQPEASGIEGIERILNHPLVMKLSGSFLAASQDDKIRKLAGHNDQEVIETQTASFTPEYITEQKKKCSQAAGRLLRVDAEAGSALLLLAELAESKPSVYAMAKEQIKNFL